MVSRSETARPLLTPGEIMQFPPADEIVMVAGTPPIRAKKARYFQDPRLQERILPPPALVKAMRGSPDDWSGLAIPQAPAITTDSDDAAPADEDTTGSERRRQPELNRARAVEKKPSIENEFEIDPVDDADIDAARNARLRDTMRHVARQAALDPGDGIEL